MLFQNKKSSFAIINFFIISCFFLLLLSRNDEMYFLNVPDNALLKQAKMTWVMKNNVDLKYFSSKIHFEIIRKQKKENKVKIKS